ncbi:hypothetical protein BSKO_10769 [Bryopsis sp. KO-2023]|nr:hypothetical protein BSKO_10769 [Bryopsis sp. KO-2023]
MSKPPPARGVRAGVRQDAKGEEKKAYDPRGAGAAWSHGFLNQKPWHPLSFRNQQKKWETEQKHLDREKKIAEGKAEFEREQEQFRSLSYLTAEEQKKYKDKQQIAFMYMKPPGLDAALKKEKAKDQDVDKAGPSQTVPAEPTMRKEKKVDGGRFDERGPMALMLKARANYESSHGLEFRPMSPPRGGFDKDADNQQFVAPDVKELDTV